MKKLFTTLVVLSVVILSGCSDNITNVPQQTNNSESLGKWQLLSSLRQNSMNSTAGYSLSKSESSKGDNSTWSYSKTINGRFGGEIDFDKDYGNDVTVEVSLNFKKNSFDGKKIITVTPYPENFYIDFSPSMNFNKPVSLDFEISGLNLSFLNSTKNKIKIDFAYISDNGSVEVIKNNGVKINIKEGTISVNNAKLDHFSRYAFITRTLE